MAGLPAPDAGVEQAFSCCSLQNRTLRMSTAPVMIVTPVIAEAFLALRDFVLERRRSI